MADCDCVKDISEMMDSHVTVPSEFIRNPVELATIVPHNYFSEHIPVINLAGLDADSPQREATMAAIASACEDWGFFQVLNHNIPVSLMESAQSVAREFFDLPLEEKRKLAAETNTPTPTGGYGRQFRNSENKTDDWHDVFMHVLRPVTAKSIEKLPNTPAAYRETMEKYGDGILNLMYQMLEIFSTLLGLQPKYLEQRFGDPIINMRLIFYPSCPQPDLVLGLGAHSDPNSLTVVLQDETGGLQVKKGNRWVGVAPVPNALVINLGDQMQVLSNGRFQSVEHRVVTNTSAVRLSLATFFHPSMDAILGPAVELVDALQPPHYPNMKYGDYRAAFHKKGLGSKTLGK